MAGSPDPHKCGDRPGFKRRATAHDSPVRLDEKTSGSGAGIVAYGNASMKVSKSAMS